MAWHVAGRALGVAIGAAVLLTGRATQAQQPATLGTLAGRVTTVDGRSLSAATIRLAPGGRATRSDSAGHFRLTALAPAVYRVTVARAGYVGREVPVRVGAGQAVTLDVALTAATTTLGEVRTTARRPGGSVALAPQVANGMIYAGTKNEIVQVAGLAANIAEKTGRQIFARVPGAFVYDMDGSGNQVNVSTRGLDPHRSWELNVRQDGVLLNSDMYGYPASHYSPPMEAIERLELTRGTAALQYGSQFGGLLNYVTKGAPANRRAAFESISSVGSYGLRSTYNSIGGTADRWSYFGYLNLRRSDGFRSNGTSDANAEYLALSFAPSSTLTLRGRVGHSRYVYRLPGPLTDAQFNADPRQATRSRNYYSPDIVVPSLSLEWQRPGGVRVATSVSGVFGPRNSVQVLGFGNQPDTANASGLLAARQVDIDRFRSLTVESRATQPWGWRGQEQVLAFGLALASNRMRRQQQGVGTRGDDFDLTVGASGFQRDVTYRTENGAAYLENLFRLTPRWSVIPGMRVEVGRTRMNGRLAYYDPDDTPRAVDHRYPLLGLRSTYQLSAAHEWYGGFSQSYRPQILKDVLPNSPLELTDPNLQDSRGWTAETGMRGSLGARVRYDVTAFEMRIGDRFGTVLRPQGAGSILFRTNVGDSRTRGLELSADVVLWQGDGGVVRAYTSTAWYDARYTTGSVVAGGQNVAITGRRVESVPSLTSRSGVALEGDRFSLQGLVSYVADTYADALNTRAPSANGAIGLVPQYTLVDLNGGIRVTRQVRVRVGVNNLLDRMYFTKRPQFYPGPGIWPSDGRSLQASLELSF
jgi:Fe(3+) dicitrate transport protein